MNVLVTGAAGFLGQRLIRALLERGELHTGGQSRPIARITALDAAEPAIVSARTSLRVNVRLAISRPGVNRAASPAAKVSFATVESSTSYSEIVVGPDGITERDVWIANASLLPVTAVTGVVSVADSWRGSESNRKI